jgi:hypothetical protein
MSYADEINLDLIEAMDRSDIDEVIEISTLQERGRLFENLSNLIKEKDAEGDTIAVEVLSWAWEQLSQL